MKTNKPILRNAAFLLTLVTVTGGAIAVLLISLILLLSGCTERMEDDGRLLPQGEYPVAFTSQMEGLGITRATVDGTWAGGEEIAVRIENETKKYTADAAGKITAPSGETPFYWQLDNETKQVTAFSYRLAATSTLTVEADQSGTGNYQESDALYAAQTPISFADATKKLTFSHLPAKVVANLKPGDDVTAQEVAGATVTFVGQSLSTPFDAATGAVTVASPGASPVSPNVLTTVPAGYQKSVQALLLPCPMQGVKFIKVTIGGDTFHYIPPTADDGKLESGKCLTYAITVNRKGLNVVLTQSEEWTGGGDELIPSTPVVTEPT